MSDVTPKQVAELVARITALEAEVAVSRCENATLRAQALAAENGPPSNKPPPSPVKPATPRLKSRAAG
jgi:hypothetical protein